MIKEKKIITCTIFLTQYCILNLHIYEPCSPSTECPPIQCLKVISQIGVGWARHLFIWHADQGMEFRILCMEFRILCLTTKYSVASFSILNRVSFGLEGSVKRSWSVVICGAKYFLQKKKINSMISFWKKELILYAKQSESRSQNKASKCFKQGIYLDTMSVMVAFLSCRFSVRIFIYTFCFIFWSLGSSS